MALDPTLSTAAFAGLESALNAVIALDPRTQRRLERLEGKVIAIAFRGLDLTLHLSPHRGGLCLMSHYSGSADTTLRGSPFDLLRMSGGQPGQGLFSGEVDIEGDTEVGQRFQRILGGLDIDWEEHLSRLTGDVVAHQLGNLARGLLGWGRNSSDRLGRDVAEYVQDEVRLTPTRPEMEQFLSAVDGVRSDVDRLEARLRQLGQQATTTNNDNS